MSRSRPTTLRRTLAILVAVLAALAIAGGAYQGRIMTVAPISLGFIAIALLLIWSPGR
jgi:hypothetical protein